MFLVFLKLIAQWLALTYVFATTCSKFVESIFAYTGNVFKWIIEEEMRTLNTTIEFLLGVKLIECLAGRAALQDLVNSLYVTVRFIFLGAILAPVAGVKVLLGALWVALLTLRVALRSHPSS